MDGWMQGITKNKLSGLCKLILKSSKGWSSQMIWDGRKERGHMTSLQDRLQYGGEDKEHFRRDRPVGPVW